MRSLKKMVGGVAVATATLGLVSGCGSGATDPTETTSDSLSLSVVTPWTTFDPAAMDCGSGRLYCQAAYDTLIHLDADRNPVPGMATSFEYDDSNTRLKLVLREGIKFSDGSAFDAVAAKASIDKFATSKGPSASQAALISSVDVISPFQIDIVLSAPDPSLLPNLASNLGMMASTSALGSEGIARVPVGSGPYLFDESTSQNGAVHFVRNPDYWDAGTYPFDKLEIRALSDPNTVMNGLTSGQLDGGMISTPEIAQSAGLSAAQTSNGWVGLVLADRAGQMEPALGKTEVRQAINLALDRNLFSESLIPGNPAQTEQIFSPGGPAYVESFNTKYDYDPDRAKNLMKQAGYESGFSVSMPDLSAFVGSPALNTALEQQLGAIGIKIDWVKVPPAELLTSMQSGKYPMFVMQLGSKTPWEDLQLSVLAGAAFNPFHTSDRDLDALAQTARFATPGEQQNAAFQDVNRWLVDNAWFAPIVVRAQTWGYRDTLQIEQQSQSFDLARFQPSEG